MLSYPSGMTMSTRALSNLADALRANRAQLGTRFAAAVSVNGVSNLMSFVGTSDIAGIWFTARYGPFWATEQASRFYREHSPITYIEQVATPLLLLQSEEDYRCPIEQGEQMLSALRLRRQTVELVRFPKASHSIAATAAPRHRYFQWKLALDWFATHLQGKEAQPTPEPEEVGVVAATPPLTDSAH